MTTGSDAVYADASALVKVVVEERESAELRSFAESLEAPLVSSSVVTVETIRAVRVSTGTDDALREAREMLAGVTLLGLTDLIFSRAADISPPLLRALDSIHLATALEIDARTMLVYDQRLADAARAYGLTVLSPGA